MYHDGAIRGRSGTINDIAGVALSDETPARLRFCDYCYPSAAITPDGALAMLRATVRVGPSVSQS